MLFIPIVRFHSNGLVVESLVLVSVGDVKSIRLIVLPVTFDTVSPDGIERVMDFVPPDFKNDKD